MSARDDYPEGINGRVRTLGAMYDELDRLNAWKAEATAVIERWDAVWTTAGEPGPLGFSKAAAVQDYIVRLRAQITRQQAVIDAFHRDWYDGNKDSRKALSDALRAYEIACAPDEVNEAQP